MFFNREMRSLVLLLCCVLLTGTVSSVGPAHTPQYTGAGLLRLECRLAACTSTGMYSRDVHTEPRYGHGNFRHRYQLFRYYHYLGPGQDYVVLERIQGEPYPIYRRKLEYRGSADVFLNYDTRDLRGEAFHNISTALVFCVEYLSGGGMALRPHADCHGNRSLCVTGDTLRLRADAGGPCEWREDSEVYIPSRRLHWLDNKTKRKLMRAFRRVAASAGVLVPGNRRLRFRSAPLTVQLYTVRTLRNHNTERLYAVAYLRYRGRRYYVTKQRTSSGRRVYVLQAAHRDRRRQDGASCVSLLRICERLARYPPPAAWLWPFRCPLRTCQLGANKPLSQCGDRRNKQVLRCCYDRRLKACRPVWNPNLRAGFLARCDPTTIEQVCRGVRPPHHDSFVLPGDSRLFEVTRDFSIKT